MAIFVKNEKQLDTMRKAGEILSQVLRLLDENVRPGIRTKELNRLAAELIKSKDCIPSFKGYNDYPADICISVNEEVIHGIPGIRRLESGDIVSVDVGVIYNGFHSDAARTFAVGEISDDLRKLLDVTEKSFWTGVENAKSGLHLNSVCSAIGDYAKSAGYGIVEEYTGHGIGKKMHEDPQIPNYKMNVRGVKMQPGMTFAIEPMVNLGLGAIKLLEDGWTVVTKDGKPSAHYENTVLITKGEPEIFTLYM